MSIFNGVVRCAEAIQTFVCRPPPGTSGNPQNSAQSAEFDAAAQLSGSTAWREHGCAGPLGRRSGAGLQVAT
jgi:hypothetical protein